MNAHVVNLTAIEAVRLDGTERVACEGAVFREHYAQCTNRAVKRRGTWHLCSPHVRKDELEVVDKEIDKA